MGVEGELSTQRFDLASNAVKSLDIAGILQHAVQEFEIFGKKDRWRLVVNDGIGNGAHSNQVGRERAASYRPISASDQNPGLGKTAPPSA